MLNTVKVPSDPTRLNTTTASFRVRFTPPAASLIDARLVGIGAGAAMREPMLVGAGAPGPAAAPRRRARVVPITWTGQLDLAVPGVLPGLVPGVAPGMTPGMVPGMASGVPAQSVAPSEELELESTQPMTLGDFEELDAYDSLDDVRVFEPASRRPPLPDAPDGVPTAQHHAWHPGKRVDLGLVLLPLRVFLGCFSVYAGFSKLCDPVYFDGGGRGSIMHWLQALHPWSVAQPLLALAMAHPVGAGLAVALVQINVGVLAILGLWQRFCAAVAMLLAFALLVTVSWQTVPVYDTPEIIYLAAWSPLLLAGAPLFSLDGWLHLEAWRRLGEHARVTQLRRRVVRRGVVLATVVVGGTLLLGSALGAAVRATHLTTTTLPGGEAPSPSPTRTLPVGSWPTGGLPVPAGSGAAGPGAPSGSSKASASPSASGHRHRGSAPSHGSTAQGGSSGSSSPSHSHNPAPAPSSTGANGVIGGLLG